MYEDAAKRGTAAEGSGTRRRRVIIHHKVTASEWEQHKERMEGLGLDPSEPIPSALSATQGGDPFDAAPVYSEMMKPPPAAPPASSGGLGLPAVSPREAATKAPHILGRSGRQAMKQTSLQKRTLEEQIQSERHERALQRWSEQQAQWERFRHIASEKTGRKKEELVVTRAEEHRERLEVFELLDRATPDEVKSGGHSWYHSLRGEGTRFVQIGNMFSGLYLPIKLHKENYVHEIVRKPLLRELHESRLAAENAEEGIRHKTWRDDEHLAHRLRRYAKKMSEIAPGQLGFHETMEPEALGIQGLRMQISATPDRSASDVGPAGALPGEEEDRTGGDDPVALQSILRPHVVEKGQPAPIALQGPHIEVSSAKLQYRTEVGKSCTISVTLKNVGTAAVDYEWKLNPPPHGFQESVLPYDPISRFSCEITRGKILPGREQKTIFTFVSETAGSFTSSWRLQTYPELITPITHIPMHGIATQMDLLEERRGVFKNDVFKQQVLHQVQELIEDIVEAVQLQPQAPPDLSIVSVQERLFSERNRDLRLYWSPHAWEHLTSLRERVEILKLKTGSGASNSGPGREADMQTQRLGRAKRGRVPLKRPDPGPPPRPPEELAPNPEQMLKELQQIETIARGAVSEASKAEIDIFNEKQDLSVEIPRAVRHAKVRPPERSPIWWAAYETVTELVLSVPRFAAHARKYSQLEPLRPFITPPHVDVTSGELVDEYEERIAARRRDREADELKEKEAKAAEHFPKIFAKHRFGPGIERFAAMAREATMVSSVRKAASASSTARERLAPYVSRQNSEGIEMSGNVVIYEADLGFLAPMMLGGNGAQARIEELQALPPPEALELAKTRLAGLQSILEANPLAVLVVAHVGQPLPDVKTEGESDAPKADEEDGGLEGDEEVDRRVAEIRARDKKWLDGVTKRMNGLISLEPLLESVREASEPAATSVEFVPHEMWLGDIEGFARRVRSDAAENKVFFLENLSAIPEEVGILRTMQAPPKQEEKPPPEPEPKAKAKAKAKAKEEVPEEPPPEPPEPPAPEVLRLPWTRRERWAERVLRELQPEVLVLDSFDAACQDFTLTTGFWPGAPMKVIGPSIDAELVSLQETLPALVKDEEAGDEAADAKGEEQTQSNAPLMLAVGGGGFGLPGSGDALLRKLQLLVGFSQVAPLERDGIVLALGGELSISILADILGLGLGERSWRPSPPELAAIRSALLEVLARPNIKVLLPRDLVCEDLGGQPPLPRPVAGGATGSRAASAPGGAAAAPAASAPAAGADGDAGAAEQKTRVSVSLSDALAVAARRPVSLGTKGGREQCAVVDPVSGRLSLMAGSPAQLAATIAAEAEVAAGEGAVPLAEVPADPEAAADADAAAADGDAEVAAAADAAPAEGAATEEELAALSPVPAGSQACDIGDETLEGFLQALKRCRGLLWNGALGIWETDDERFQHGTRALLAAVEQRLNGGEEEDEEDDEELDEDEEQDGSEAGGGASKEKKEKPEPDAEFEVALVVGRDSTQRLMSLLETPSIVSFISQSGEALLQMFRGEPLPGILACADRTTT
eukprot:TRINITY_DN889_c1_g1_i1.p1 TRINITY_DN889_c1_g1~~TRINITY_DN889_c1_g1_i1.p1  ORF type:complete len:1560 (-),score=453.98 TRINITY_DN889_c1_g1_i1:54-4733(-)